MKYLEDNNKQNSKDYFLTLHAIKQGEIFYKNRNFEYREYAMFSNFVCCFDNLNNQKILGFFGANHTNLDNNLNKANPSMGIFLQDYYDVFIKSEIIDKENYKLNKNI